MKLTRNLLPALTLALLCCLAACSSLFVPSVAPLEDRPTPFLPGGAYQRDIINGLTAQERASLYSMDEGIHWLPVDVLLSFKRANDSLGVYDEAFFARPERLGLIPNLVNPNSELPIGVTSSDDSVPMVGINCAACHTSVVANEAGDFFLVDGGSSQFAIDRIIEGMIKSLIATLINPVEFDAFFERYQARSSRRGLGELGVTPSGEEPELEDSGLSEEIKGAVESGDLTSVVAVLNANKPLGYRATAFGAAPSPGELATRTGLFFYLAKRFVFFFQQVKYGSPTEGSEVSPSGLGRSNPWSVTKKMFGDHLGDIRLGAKPVSTVIDGGPINTPHVWDFDRVKFVFWTGVTNSMVERNLAQGVALITDFDWETVSTTIKLKKLEEVSVLMRKVRAPTWPRPILGPVDSTLAQTGKEIFTRRCIGCHDPMSDMTATGSAELGYYDVGTDPSYYEGQMELLGSFDLFGEVLAPLVGKVKARAAQSEGITDLAPYETGRTPVIWRKPTGNKFVAKPLQGIWATAPYLHNGSVPTIDDLLKPVSQRPKTFFVGSFTYDVLRLGFESQKTDLPWAFKFDTSLKGNSNQGHEFTLDPVERAAVIEFLKDY